MTKKADVHNLYELAFANQVTKDIPDILSLLREFQPKIEKYMSYKDVAEISDKIDEARTMLQLHYDYYQVVVEKKGKL